MVTQRMTERAKYRYKDAETEKDGDTERKTKTETEICKEKKETDPERHTRE